MADETTQGCHPFTVGWWSRLPAAYRAADRAQGYRLTDSWHGLNRDPRFITGWDGWHRTNTSTEAWKASVAFSRTFRVAPNVPLYVRSWHAPVQIGAGGERIPLLSGTKVRHVIRNYTGQIIADDAPLGSGSTAPETAILDGGGPIVGNEDVFDGGTASAPPPAGDTPPAPTTPTDQIVHMTRVIPDKFAVVQVTIHVEVAVPNARDFISGVHVGARDVAFSELPGIDYFTTAAAYPLLRYMDGVGHQAGYLSDQVNEMHEGKWADPVTAPESRLMFLSAVLGVPYRYASRLTMGQLRQHLVDLVEGNSPTPGSTNHIAITAKQWLTGTKDVSVVPAHTMSSYSGPDPTHTIIVTARADEVPGNDLQAFAAFLNDSGVIPAGHDVRVIEATPDWNSWEAASGVTWNDQAEVIQTWNDSDSAGVNLSGEGA